MPSTTCQNFYSSEKLKATESPRSGGLRENFLFVCFLNKPLSAVNMKAFCKFFLKCYIQNINFSLCLHFQPDAAGHLTDSSWGKKKTKMKQKQEKKIPPPKFSTAFEQNTFIYFFLINLLQ